MATLVVAQGSGGCNKSWPIENGHAQAVLKANPAIIDIKDKERTGECR